MRHHVPTSSYVVWHTQRTGSTLLCTTLEATQIAGHPEEWPESRLQGATADASRLRDELWTTQTTSNGVLAVKFSYHQQTVDRFFNVFGRSAGRTEVDLREAWDSVFPNCRHVVMTRRNRYRQAISWWKLINGGPGHLSQDGTRLPWQDALPSTPPNLVDSYDFNAIKALVFESVEREVGVQELLYDLGATPHSVTYEDFVADYERTVRGVLSHLSLDGALPGLAPPLLARTSDDIDEEWLRRFLHDLSSRGWLSGRHQGAGE